MAKVLFVCRRDRSDEHENETRQDLESIARRIAPDNLVPRSVQIHQRDGISSALFSPSETVLRSDAGICLGHLLSSDQWEIPGAPRPEGSFVLFRFDADLFELLTDAVGSRPAWYYLDDHLLIAGTSQRAIVSLLKDFEFDERIIPWILSTGTPGSVINWDKRIKRLGPNSRLTLDRRSWILAASSSKASFHEVYRDPTDAKKSLRAALQSTVGKMVFDPELWILPLSGGYDSRALLFNLQNGKNLKTITWGEASSRDEKGNDALIAEQVAAAFGTPHEFVPIEDDSERTAETFRRFVACGEGGVDHVSAYLDGFEFWKRLHDRNLLGIIRGDTVWASKPVNSEADVWRTVGLLRWEDYRNLPTASSCGVGPQDIPTCFNREQGESLLQWRDRLHQTYRIPVILSALNELKTHYVEIACPLLTLGMVNFFNSVSDDLRSEKRLFKSIFHDGGPFSFGKSKIGFATRMAIAARDDSLGTPAAVSTLQASLDSKTATSLFSPTLLSMVRDNLSIQKRRKNQLRSEIRSAIDPRLRKIIRDIRQKKRAGPTMNFNVLAFRIFTIVNMHDLLTADAASLARSRDL